MQGALPSLTLLALLVKLIVPGPSQVAGCPPVSQTMIRLWGVNRQYTAIAISQDSFPADQSSSAVLLARDDLYPDGLAGAPLARRLNAPLLLARAGTINPDVMAEIARVISNDKPIYILGSFSALAPEIETQLDSRGFNNHRRIGGPTRYETAAYIADYFPTNTQTMGIASGENFPDALTLAAPAALYDFPLLLVRSTSLPPITRDYLLTHINIDRVHLAGGTVAISQAVENDVAALVGGPSVITRYPGADRYDTSQRIARGLYPSPVCLIAFATGQKFPDAETSGQHTARHKMPLVLVKKDSVPDTIRQYLNSLASEIIGAYIYGGPDAVSNSTATQLEAIIEP